MSSIPDQLHEVFGCEDLSKLALTFANFPHCETDVQKVNSFIDSFSEYLSPCPEKVKGYILVRSRCNLQDINNINIKMIIRFDEDPEEVPILNIDRYRYIPVTVKKGVPCYYHRDECTTTVLTKRDGIKMDRKLVIA